jgi:hypothetical protein
MIFDWYLIFNLNEFVATDLVSRKVKVLLEDVGEKEVLITKGNVVSVLYEDVLLPIDFQTYNPFIGVGELSHYAVYKDSSANVWLGIETAE